MALQGTLADLGIVDLIQFPHAGKKTGELALASRAGSARLFYEHGALVHAEFGAASGAEALSQIVDFAEGSFEFRPESRPERRSIELELHRALMLALKTRDERRLAEERRRAEASARGGAGDNTRMNTTLTEFLESVPSVAHVALLAFNGDILASQSRDTTTADELEPLCSALHTLCQNHPRPGLSRVLLEDAGGTIAATQLEDGRAAVLVATRQAQLGAVTVALNKLRERVEGRQD